MDMHANSPGVNLRALISARMNTTASASVCFCATSHRTGTMDDDWARKSSPSLALRTLQNTTKPFDANRSAVARPMPDEAPVTKTAEFAGAGCRRTRSTTNSRHASAAPNAKPTTRTPNRIDPVSQSNTISDNQKASEGVRMASQEAGARERCGNGSTWPSTTTQNDRIHDPNRSPRTACKSDPQS